MAHAGSQVIVDTNVLGQTEMPVGGIMRAVDLQRDLRAPAKAGSFFPKNEDTGKALQYVPLLARPDGVRFREDMTNVVSELNDAQPVPADCNTPEEACVYILWDTRFIGVNRFAMDARDPLGHKTLAAQLSGITHMFNNSAFTLRRGMPLCLGPPLFIYERGAYRCKFARKGAEASITPAPVPMDKLRDQFPTLKTLFLAASTPERWERLHKSKNKFDIMAVRMARSLDGILQLGADIFCTPGADGGAGGALVAGSTKLPDNQEAARKRIYKAVRSEHARELSLILTEWVSVIQRLYIGTAQNDAAPGSFVTISVHV